MASRNLFDSFNIKQENFTNIYYSDHPIIDLTEENDINDDNDLYMSDFLSIKNDLQTIDIFKSFNTDLLLKFFSPCKVELVDLPEVEIVDNDEFKIQTLLIEYDTVKTIKKSDFSLTKFRFPSLLVSKMDDNSTIDSIDTNAQYESRIPIQIEIETGLPDLKRSDIITKLDLSRFLCKKSKMLTQTRKTVKRKSEFDTPEINSSSGKEV